MEWLSGETRKKIGVAVTENSNGNLQKRLEDIVGEYLYSETRRRPMVFVNINR
jgi:mRNA degradation ribonuclease J1/J2